MLIASKSRYYFGTDKSFSTKKTPEIHLFKRNSRFVFKVKKTSFLLFLLLGFHFVAKVSKWLNLFNLNWRKVRKNK